MVQAADLRDGNHCAIVRWLNIARIGVNQHEFRIEDEP